MESLLDTSVREIFTADVESAFAEGEAISGLFTKRLIAELRSASVSTTSATPGFSFAHATAEQ